MNVVPFVLAYNYLAQLETDFDFWMTVLVQIKIFYHMLKCSESVPHMRITEARYTQRQNMRISPTALPFLGFPLIANG